MDRPVLNCRCIKCDREINRWELPYGIEQRFNRLTGERIAYGEICRGCLRSAALDELGKLDGELLPEAMLNNSGDR